MNHEELARHNLTLAESEGDVPWKVTKYFYAAVHAIDAKLFPGSRSPATGYDHKERETRLFNAGLSELYKKHMRLKAMSMDARYRPWTHAAMGPRLSIAKHLAGEIMKESGLT